MKLVVKASVYRGAQLSRKPGLMREHPREGRLAARVKVARLRLSTPACAEQTPLEIQFGMASPRERAQGRFPGVSGRSVSFFVLSQGAGAGRHAESSEWAVVGARHHGQWHCPRLARAGYAVTCVDVERAFP